jgi:hypothetical protein
MSKYILLFQRKFNFLILRPEIPVTTPMPSLTLVDPSSTSLVRRMGSAPDEFPVSSRRDDVDDVEEVDDDEADSDRLVAQVIIS